MNSNTSDITYTQKDMRASMRLSVALERTGRRKKEAIARTGESLVLP